jgi:hypothetical protein
MVRGSEGGRLVVQLALPIDVIFFERRETSSLTEILMPLIAKRGYATRLNSSTARLEGDYNVVYSGDEVPLSALKEVVDILATNGVKLRSIQPQIHLKNGIQNQIQVGSSQSVECLNVIDQTRLRALIQTHSDAEFLSAVRLLPQPTCS